MLDKKDVARKRLTAVFSALGNPVRLRILSIITETARPLHIKAVARGLQMDYAAVYRHVDVLKKAGLVQIFEVGRSRVLSPLHADLIMEMLALAQKIENE
jgi:DNA-binding transcriptional ArsR family regulator